MHRIERRWRSASAETAYPAALGTRACCACSEKAPAERDEDLAASCAAACSLSTADATADCADISGYSTLYRRRRLLVEVRTRVLAFTVNADAPREADWGSRQTET
jgi:hypothetical protein